MYYTHHFAHEETLSRARSWLAQLGLKPHQIHVHAGASPRIALEFESPWLAEIRLLINAVERSDPDRSPGFWGAASHSNPQSECLEEAPLVQEHPRHGAVIGWHPPDSAPETDPDLRRLCEAMSR